MDHREYQVLRAELGQALRDVRWERKAIYLMFQGTRDPELIQAGCEWAEMLVACDIRLCREIVRLDNEFRNGGDSPWKT